MSKQEEIKQALAAATPEWFDNGNEIVSKQNPKEGIGGFLKEEDNHLAAKAPEYISYLLAENERLEQRNQELDAWATEGFEENQKLVLEIVRLRKELEEARKELDLTQSEVRSVERLGLKYQNRIQELSTPRTLEEWHEDYGDVLWWELHVAEPPYCGSPLCSDWPGYHTHWTPIVTPNFGQEGEGNQDANGEA